METDLRPPVQTDRLVIQTVAVPDPGDLISQLPQPGALAWVRRGEGLVGWGEVARITLPAGEDRFTVGEKWLRSLLDTAEIDDQVGVPGSGPVAFGSFTFDPASDGSVLVLPATVLGRRNGQAWLTTIGPVPATQAEAGLGGMDEQMPVTTPGEVSWHEGSQSAAQWEEAVAAAVDRIKSGALRKVVLARDLYATAPVDLDVRALLGRLAVRYPECYTFASAGLVGATPELLIRREGTQISALVLAGTIPRGSTPERDEALGAALLASVKDREEHDYAAAGVRETLAPLCAQLTMDDTPFLLRLANVQHLATSVTGTLAPPRQAHPAHPAQPDWTGQPEQSRPEQSRPEQSRPGHTERARRPEPPPSALALAAALHPTAAVCGTPTETAMELIRELEGMDRGRYAGPVGWVDAQGNGEWGIAMRCAELDGPRARLFAGCGIVAGSQPGAEQAEAQAKFRPMQDALEGRQP